MIIGHQKIIEFLNKSIINRKLAHAYLFVGQEHLGKRTIALEFAKILQCQNRSEQNLSYCDKCVSCQEMNKNAHPDVLLIEPEIIEEKEKKREQEIGIDKIRDVQRQLSLFSFRGGYKVVIIDFADRMTRQAANALLKTLEEPSAKTIFILISAAPRNLLPTIVSRCLTVKFSLVKNEAIEKFIEKAGSAKIPKISLAKIASFSFGKPGLAVAYLKQPELIKMQEKAMQEAEQILRKNLNFRFHYAENLAKDLNSAQNFLNNWLFIFRNMILLKNNCFDLTLGENKKEDKDLTSITNAKLAEIARKIIEAKKNLANSSLNARLILEALMLNF